MLSEYWSANKLLRYFYPLFFIPMNFFLMVGGIGYGIQWIFFRYQSTSLGDSVIPLGRDLFYVTSGLITGKSVTFEILPIISASIFFIAFLYAMAGRTKAAGLLTIGSGLVSLASSILQYGITFHGGTGMCIPFGSVILLFFGILLILAKPDREPENFLVKYDYLILLVGVFLVFSSWAVPTFPNDTIGSQLLPYSLVENHNFYLNVYPEYTNDILYGFRFYDTGNGHYLSIFPIVNAVLIVPLYSIPFFLGIPFTGMTQLVMTHISAALIGALAVMFVYLGCCLLSNRTIALVSAIVFAFATDTWSIGSQTLYAHGMSELLLALMIFLVIRNEKYQSFWNFVGLGICSGLFIFNRPSDSLLLLPIIGYVMWYHRDKIGYYLVSGLLSGLPFLVYNQIFFHSILGGYSMSVSRLTITASILPNYLGLLVSPNKGLFIFSPVLILSILGFWLIREKHRSLCRFFQWSLIAMALTVLVYASFDDWAGGNTYGPRYLTCLLPYMVIGMCIFFGSIAKKPRNTIFTVAIAILILISVFIQFIGVFYYPQHFVPAQNWYNQWSSDNPWDACDSVIVSSLFHTKDIPVQRNNDGTWLKEVAKEQCIMPGIIQLFQNDPDRYEQLCGMGYPAS